VEILHGLSWEGKAMKTAVPSSHAEALKLFVMPTYFITVLASRSL